ncbi:hypothetical protein K457DRAFT_34568 [Linnemannia elongata AG-77]|uniref:P-loop containing nucleoside triphosphate hydrolase protein n=1 Tax=Linnemannia elongata AG-77 TaxID=1314771 RepID=A0A197JQA2_9FUNG|nr:hypothetical protein K457DRAFT_1866326 [Linnemannia elongata AG-77]OAQ27138.1 hypothetical protein K457DRAFT_34568 [Linnemannia elongata AG-77]
MVYPIELVESTLPLAYSIASALLIVHLSRKPIHLDQYDALKDNLNEDDLDIPTHQHGDTTVGHRHRDSSAINETAQASEQYQAQRNSGMGINLARLGLSAFALGLSVFSLALFHLNSNDNDATNGDNEGHNDTFSFAAATERYSLLADSIRSLSWVYALALSFVFLIRPAVAFQFWVRPQLDFFYVLQLALTSVQLYRNDVLTTPFSEWSLRLKLEDALWLTTAALIWISLITKPYQPWTPPKKLKEGEIERVPAPESAASLYSFLTFSWINPWVYLGFKRPLLDNDLPPLARRDLAQHSVQRFRITNYFTNKKRSTFTRTLIYALRWDFFIQFLLALPYGALSIISPLCLNKITKFIECRDCGKPGLDMYAWVFALLFASILGSLCQQAALHMGRRIFVRATSICNAEVFAKSLRRKDVNSSLDSKRGEDGEAPGKKKEGNTNISNLVAVDVQRLEQAVCYMHMCYEFPVQFTLASVQLYYLLGPAAFVGIGFMVVTLPIPAKLYSAMRKLFREIMETKDERMDTLTEMLSAIRIVKFFGWEGKFVEKITTAREKELKRTKDSYTRMAITNLAWQIIPLLNIVVIFWAYTRLFGNEITASALFTTLALLEILRQALGTIPWAMMSIMRAQVSLKRIGDFLDEEELIKDTTVTKVDGKAPVHASSHPTIGFVNASYSWPNKEQEKVPAKAAVKKDSWIQKIKAKFSKDTPKPAEPEVVAEPEAVQERFQLKNISADFPVGELSVIVGPTGSGKSALLLALLGELERTEGHMYLPRLDYDSNGLRPRGSGIAYVSQTAWLQNTTIRDNILFGKAFDQDRYDAVIEGCALITDFEVLEAGDHTQIGEQGITLSGGQKQRVALARAVYSDANVLLLDDCLSAVDTHTGKRLFQTLSGPLLAGRSILMATHQVQLTLSAAAYVVALDKGVVLGTGTPEECIRNGWIDHVKLVASESDAISMVSTLDGEDAPMKAKATDKSHVVSKLTEDEKKVVGAVSWKVYKAYIDACGGYPVWFLLLCITFLMEFVDIGQKAWLARWGNKVSAAAGSLVLMTFGTVAPEPIVHSLNNIHHPTNATDNGLITMAMKALGNSDPVSVEFYLGVYILLSLFTMAFSIFGGYYITVFVSIRGSRTLHAQLLDKVSRAKVRFFDTTPIGRIINRFSSDISTIDEAVNRTLLMFITQVITIIGIIGVISFNMPMFLIAAVFIVIIYSAIGMFYVPISRDLKRLNSNSRSPILNHFNETLVGIATIRAYGFQDRFVTRNLVNVDDNNRTFFLLWTANRWLHWRVDIAGALVAFSTGMLILQNSDTIQPGWAAMSLTYSLMFTGTVVWVIRSYTECEMNLNAVERVVEYMDLEAEPAAIIPGSRPPASWPHKGEIVVDHLTMKYAPDTPEVIKNISFTVKAGEKIGVVGRTGSGKSTLAISLFRFMEPAGGRIVIDGIDIGKIGLHDLRSKLTIIPQDPILFKGTLRFNLDPFNEHEDFDLWEALRRSHLIPASAVRLDGTATPKVSSSPAAKSPAGSTKDDVSASTEIVDPSKITLDTVVKENGSNFSQGQRQLIALARALVRRSKIIVMDEATASVDFETDLKVQTTIREEMSEATIITIAHRIRTIADFDRVLVMDAGEIAEYDRPYTLMTKDSLFRSMCERSTELDALLEIAKAKEERDSAAARS